MALPEAFQAGSIGVSGNSGFRATKPGVEKALAAHVLATVLYQRQPK